ncbi:hypothetical protein COLO4_29808 [Corchorus olitorius]|uniref:Uncharacterized protein n=1 Tax=Corchorus olitorius TaxID=93759 RepID=A0A1R3HCZ1_9ROSI|nr:hypothetical protein COLO4_29808 [Corchorus olitorius]
MAQMRVKAMNDKSKGRIYEKKLNSPSLGGRKGPKIRRGSKKAY